MCETEPEYIFNGLTTIDAVAPLVYKSIKLYTVMLYTKLVKTTKPT